KCAFAVTGGDLEIPVISRVEEYGMKNFITWAGMVMLFTIPLVAQQSATSPPQSSPDSSAMEQRIKDLEERIIALEGQVRMLKAAQAAPAPEQPAAAPAEATAQAAAQAPSPAAAQVATPTAGTLPSYGRAGGSAATALTT